MDWHWHFSWRLRCDSLWHAEIVTAVVLMDICQPPPRAPSRGCRSESASNQRRNGSFPRRQTKDMTNESRTVLSLCPPCEPWLQGARLQTRIKAAVKCTKAVLSVRGRNRHGPFGKNDVCRDQLGAMLAAATQERSSRY